jgi:multidrug efflux pump subunit AcrA (membrane-fusion protein)
MKHFPKYVAGTVGIVALGWIVPVFSQQGAPPRPLNLNPAVSVPPAAPGAPAFGGSPSAVPFNSAGPNTPRPTQLGLVKVPYALVTATDDVKVPARDAGTLTKVNVKGGELVNADFVLGIIDDRDTLAKQRIAQGELDAANAQFNSKAEIEAAKKGYEVANNEWEQAKQIRRQREGAISEQEYRRAEFQAQRAFAQIQVAETDNLVAGLTAKMKKAQLDATDIELGKKKIEAPIQGQVVEVYKHMGEWVQPGDPVLRLVRLDKVRVEGFVYASKAGRGDVEGKPVKVTVHLPGEKQIELNGRVDYVSPLIEGSGSNRQYRIWAEVENQFVDGNFLIQPGASAEMTIDTTAAKLPPAVDATAPAIAPPALNGFAPRSELPAGDAPAVETRLKPETPATPAVAPAPAPSPIPMPAATPMATAPAGSAPPAARPVAVPKGAVTPKSTTANPRPMQPR